MHEFYHIAYLFAIAFLNSIDNMGIGIAYSISGKKVPLFKNFLISTMAFVVSYVSTISGSIAARFLNERTCTILSVAILTFMGARMIYEAFSKKEEEDPKLYNIISNKEAITVGTLLALDDVGSSVSSGLVGYGPVIVSLPFFIISFIIFFLANYGTKFTSKLNIGRKATIVSGALMIVLGLLRLFD
jgi:putative Mn2+ efflux pump MntP